MKVRLLVLAVTVCSAVAFAAGKKPTEAKPADLAAKPAAAAPAKPDPVKPGAKADLKDGTGKEVGTATFTETKEGVKVALDVSGLKEGKHGFHIHAVGKCDGPDFKSAGGHFNPGNKKHGHAVADGAHAGDLPNLEVGKDGKGKLELTVKDVTLGAEGPTALLNPTGTALVIHADADDDKTDPAGNAGARVACGVIAPIK